MIFDRHRAAASDFARIEAMRAYIESLRKLRPGAKIEVAPGTVVTVEFLLEVTLTHLRTLTETPPGFIGDGSDRLESRPGWIRVDR